jgi:hypothetical protein
VNSNERSSIRHLNTSAHISIRQHTSAYVSIRQHTSAYRRCLLKKTRVVVDL